jgi:hypothetical protein
LGDRDEGVGEALRPGEAFVVGHRGELFGPLQQRLFESVAIGSGEASPHLVVGLIEGGLQSDCPILEDPLFVTAGDPLVAGGHTAYPGDIPTRRSGYEIGAGSGANQTRCFHYPIKRHGSFLQLGGQVGLVGQAGGGLSELLGGVGGQVHSGSRPLGEGS